MLNGSTNQPDILMIMTIFTITYLVHIWVSELVSLLKSGWQEKYQNFTYADDTIFMTESKEELESLLMKVKEESENAGLKLNIQKAKTMASSSITSW